MAKLIGVASEVVHSTQREAAGECGFVIAHLVSFRIKSEQVRYKAYERPTIEEGDQVAVAGTFCSDSFNALVFENRSRHVRGSIGKLPHLFAGLAAWVFGFATSGPYELTALFAAVLGAYWLVRAAMVAAAERELADLIGTRPVSEQRSR